MTLVVLLAAGSASAQEDPGALTGVVVDAATGAPLAGARVTATGPAIGAPRATACDDAGRFVLGALPPGTYRLEALAAGYLPGSSEGLSLTAGASLPVTLAVAPETVVLEEVVITGSRLQRKDLITPAPLSIVSREQLIASGKLTVADFIQALPYQANATNANLNNFSDGSVRASLRGLGDHRTLVLVNGRRYVAGGSGADQSVDLGTLPSAAVERIEILRDGASPVYGSEAIGGVINVITRRGWAGTEATATAAGTAHGDGASYTAGLTTGQAGPGGSAVLSLAYQKTEPAWMGNRGWSSYAWRYDTSGLRSPSREVGPYAVGSGGTPGGRAFVPTGPGSPAPNPDGEPRIDLYNQLVATYPTATSFTPDPTAPLGWRPWAGDALPLYGGDQYNPLPEMYLVTPSARLQVFATGDARLGVSSRGFVELTYVNRRSRQRLAPEPIVLQAEGFTVAGSNPYNPFGVDIWAGSARPLGMGPRTFSQDVDALRLLAGVDGTLPDGAGPLEGWRWEVSANLGRSVYTEEMAGQPYKPGLRDALGPYTNYGTPEAPDWGCGTPEARISGCVPIPFFDPQQAFTSEQVSNVTYTAVSRGSNELAGGLATLAGEAFRLPSGRPVGLALGYEYRRVSGTISPDAMMKKGGGTNAPDTWLDTSGSQTVNEGFLEVGLPLLEGLPWAEVVEAQLAARVFNYSGFGTDWTWKAGARWKPLQDLTLRGTVSTAFRAPSVMELWLGATTDTVTVTDPCAGVDAEGQPVPTSPWCGAAANNGQQDPVVTWRNQGNPALRPELARVFTVGVVVEPRLVPRLSVTVDYYGVAIDHVIQGLNGMQIDACYPTSAEVAPMYCQFVSRDPVTRALTGVEDVPVNVGSERMTGIDVAIRYDVPTAAGRFGLAWDSTWLEKYDIIVPDGRVLHARGSFDLPRGAAWANPTLRFNAAASWTRGGLRAGLDTRYVGSLKECSSEVGPMGDAYCSWDHAFERRVSESWVWNAQLGYRFLTSAGATDLQIGAQNLLDAAPPRVYAYSTTQFGWASDPGYDFAGRTLYLRLAHRL